MNIFEGHGKTSYIHGEDTTRLQHVQVPYVTNTDCTTVYNYDSNRITPNMMCAGETDKDACQGLVFLFHNHNVHIPSLFTILDTKFNCWKKLPHFHL